MAQRKRLYVPKIKGCYECSQRRIHCDGAQPSCRKCASRDIACSGFGVKYRFRNGLIPRTKRVGKIGDLDPTEAPCQARPRFANDVDAGQVMDRSGKTREVSQVVPGSIGGENEIRDGNESYPWLLGGHDPSSASSKEINIAEPQQATGCCSNSIASAGNILPAGISLTLEFSSTNSRNEFLLKYYNIAPEMVVIDDGDNGWRHLILPIACIDELVMNSVLAVSAFHLSGRAAGQRVADPSRLYARAIHELQKRKNLGECGRQTQQFVILAIVVLLVAVMVNGCSDFPIIFHMLQSALDTVGGDRGLADGEVAEFLLRQIHKMRVFAGPFISPDVGVHALLSQAPQSFDCLRYYSRRHPDHSRTLDLIASVRQQACNIYLHRVSAIGVGTASEDLIETFKMTLESFPEGSPGEHVLVWASFIAASESCRPDHQRFFVQFLERHYRRNRFANILQALKLLQRIWARNIHESWPALLPEPGVFIN